MSVQMSDSVFSLSYYVTLQFRARPIAARGRSASATRRLPRDIATITTILPPSHLLRAEYRPRSVW
jgi:hypothetical protein